MAATAARLAAAPISSINAATHLPRLLNASQPKLPSFHPTPPPPHHLSIRPSRHLTAAPAASRPASSAPGVLELEVAVDDQLLELSRGAGVLGSRLVTDLATLGRALKVFDRLPTRAHTHPSHL